MTEIADADQASMIGTQGNLIKSIFVFRSPSSASRDGVRGICRCRNLSAITEEASSILDHYLKRPSSSSPLYLTY